MSALYYIYGSKVRAHEDGFAYGINLVSGKL